MNASFALTSWGRRVLKNLLKTPKKNLEEGRSHWNIIRGDSVGVIHGPHIGQRGTILHVLRKTNRVIVDGVNIRKRIIKPSSDGMTPGKFIMRPCSIHYSNVMLIDPSTNEPTKVSRQYLEDGSKVRISKKSGVIIPKPDFNLFRKPRSLVIGPKDTKVEDVFEVTFFGYEQYLPRIYGSEKKKQEENKQQTKPPKTN